MNTPPTETTTSPVSADSTVEPRPLARAAPTPTSVRAAQWALPVILLAFIALFSVLQPATFATQGNFTTLLGSEAVLILVALGAMLPLIVGQYDLSVGANMGMASIAVAMATSELGFSTGAGIAVAIVLSTLLGFVNGFLVAKIGISSFVATLAVSSLLSGIVIWSTDAGALQVGELVAQIGHYRAIRPTDTIPQGGGDGLCGDDVRGEGEEFAALAANRVGVSLCRSNDGAGTDVAMIGANQARPEMNRSRLLEDSNPPVLNRDCKPRCEPGRVHRSAMGREGHRP